MQCTPFHFLPWHSAIIRASNKFDDEALVLTEARAPFRILHVNRAWCDMCGYQVDDAIGQSNKILQGEKTNKDAARVRTVATRALPRPCSLLSHTCVLLYKLT